MSARPSPLLTLGALFLSVGLNAYLLLRPPAVSGPQTCPAAKLARAPGTRGAPPEDGCQARLRRCRQEEVSQLVKIIRAGGGVRQGVGSQRGKPGAAAVDSELQQSVLCDITRRHQRERWFRKRHGIARSLVPSLKDRPKQQRELERDVKRFAGVLGWSEDQQVRFQQSYEQVRRERVTSALAALKRKPVAFGELLVQLRGLYSDEDRLVRELFGQQAADQLRASQLEKRTLIVALAAAMARVPWDHSISW